MRHIALLRGINVGGNNKVPMAELRAALENDGFTAVQSYIASGNILLSADGTSLEEVQMRFERLLETTFSVSTRVLVIPETRFLPIAAALPGDWHNDSDHKSDVIFLFPEDDTPAIRGTLAPRDGIDETIYVPGAVLWRVPRRFQTKSALNKLVGTKTYRNVTIRNANTVRKLQQMLQGS